MSTRRKPGDWVWVRSGCGFVIGKRPFRARIQDGHREPCLAPSRPCDDPDCTEWGELITESGIVGSIEG